jgi:hypothetical protein
MICGVVGATTTRDNVAWTRDVYLPATSETNAIWSWVMNVLMKGGRRT